MDEVTVDANFGSISYSQTLFMVILYLVIGCCAILANTLNIIIFSTHRELRKTFAFIIVLDIGEIVNGLSYILTGIGRWMELQHGRFGHPIGVKDCFFSRYWPIPLILGTQIPAIMTILVSAERIIAVHRPGHYSSIFCFRNKVFLIIATISLLGLSLFWAGYTAFISDRVTSTSHCGIITSTGKDFSTFHFVFVPFAYLASFLSLCFISNLQKKTITSTSSAVYGKRPQLKTFIIMTAADIVLCTIPSVVMIGANFDLWQPNNIITSLAYSTTGFLSICHMIVNLTSQTEYRKQIQRFAKHFVGIHSSTVETIKRRSSAFYLRQHK